MPIGDASGGAVHHAGGSMNYAARDAQLDCGVVFMCRDVPALVAAQGGIRCLFIRALSGCMRVCP